MIHKYYLGHVLIAEIHENSVLHKYTYSIVAPASDIEHLIKYNKYATLDAAEVIVYSFVPESCRELIKRY